MHNKVLNRPDIAEAFIPMVELQDHLRINDPHDEAIIEQYRSSAIDIAESYMNRVLGVCDAVASFETYKPRTYLPLGDIHSIEEVKAIDLNGYDVLIDRANYQLNQTTNELIFTYQFTVNMRSLRYTDFQVKYKVGYEVEAIPHAIKIGCMKLVATMFDSSREDVVVGASISELPLNHQYCFDLHRIPSGG
ncbi:phage gp6-like head-tail connector protein [Photobacterium damselae]|uniref:phage gp6-like head-tail connector protein n=1 Tax=Photobacterium damselae TaxID=38293 RepID=UPI00165E5D71|nr:phage gp6-like head-tail connector protein [Photobacterium damselae]